VRIDEIAVDGFGRLRGDRLEPAAGLTLIRGANEAGKSTLLAFIRAILFGFETRAYPALAGGQRGGWLKITAGDGRRIRIERHGDTGGTGRLRILDDQGDELGDDLLPRILQGVERTVYNNVFAFGLAELAQLGSLGGPEIAARIYGAGMGTGATSIVDIESRLEQRRAALFSKGGQKPRMNVLLGEIDGLNNRLAGLDLPASFKAADNRRDELEARLAELNQVAAEVSTELRHLERLEAGWKSWLALNAARASWTELAGEMGPPASDPADELDARASDLLERFTRSEGELERIASRGQDLADSRARAIAERDAQPVDPALVTLRPELERLLQAVPGIRTDRDRITDRDQELVVQNGALAEALRRLGPDWTEERLVSVDDSLAAQTAIAGPFRTSLEAADRDVGQARSELASADQVLADARLELAAIEPDEGRLAAPSTTAESGRRRQVQWLGFGLGLSIVAALGGLVLGLDALKAIVLGGVIGVAVGLAGWLGQSPRTAGSSGIGGSPAMQDASGLRRQERHGRVRAAEQRQQATPAWPRHARHATRSRPNGGPG
jgi:uncharacterized protein YhaN